MTIRENLSLKFSTRPLTILQQLYCHKIKMIFIRLWLIWNVVRRHGLISCIKRKDRKSVMDFMATTMRFLYKASSIKIKRKLSQKGWCITWTEMKEKNCSVKKNILRLVKSMKILSIFSAILQKSYTLSSKLIKSLPISTSQR